MCLILRLSLIAFLSLSLPKLCSPLIMNEPVSTREIATRTTKTIAAITVLTSFKAASAATSIMHQKSLLIPMLLDSFSDQVITSLNSNSLVEDWRTWKHPPIYKYTALTNSAVQLPYPAISDNTEGIAGFYDLPIPADAKLLVDIGGGRYDACKMYIENKYKHQGLKFVIIDPFARSAEYNARSHSLVDDAGGADVATSISVLNVIETRAHRVRHIKQVRSALKQNGLAFFKIWSGYWPMRGSGVPGNLFRCSVHMHIVCSLKFLIS